MKKSRYTEEQIIGILKQHEAGVKTADLCREHGISDATFYNWKSKYGGLDVSEAQRLKAMEDENRRLKLLVRLITGAFDLECGLTQNLKVRPQEVKLETAYDESEPRADVLPVDILGFESPSLAAK